jgi:hypothetical protein
MSNKNTGLYSTVFILFVNIYPSLLKQKQDSPFVFVYRAGDSLIATFVSYAPVNDL